MLHVCYLYYYIVYIVVIYYLYYILATKAEISLEAEKSKKTAEMDLDDIMREINDSFPPPEKTKGKICFDLTVWYC